MTSILLALDPIPTPSDPENPSDIACSGCHDRIMIHQPDERLPDRLLGACDSCRAWFLIDAVAAVMIRLPDRDALGVV
jgi:hypothetical protein